MQCPFCAEKDTRVVDSRLVSEGDQVRRRRECSACRERFTTYEKGGACAAAGGQARWQPCALRRAATAGRHAARPGETPRGERTGGAGRRPHQTRAHGPRRARGTEPPHRRTGHGGPGRTGSGGLRALSPRSIAASRMWPRFAKRWSGWRRNPRRRQSATRSPCCPTSERLPADPDHAPERRRRVHVPCPRARGARTLHHRSQSPGRLRAGARWRDRRRRLAPTRRRSPRRGQRHPTRPASGPAAPPPT